MSKRTGRKPLNQYGITIFEISIITLIIILVTVSTWIIIAKVNTNSQKNYNKYDDVQRIGQ